MKIGLTEILVILAVALIVLGPDKLPFYMKKFGKALKELKKYSGELTEDIKENVITPLNEAQQPLREAMAPIEELDKTIRTNVKDVESSIKNFGKLQPQPKQDTVTATSEAVATQEVSETAGASELVSQTSEASTETTTTTATTDTDTTTMPSASDSPADKAAN